MAMNVLKLSLFNLRQRMLAGVLTGFLVALGVGLVASIWALQRQAQRSFEQSIGKFHLLLGPKGSGLQLTLNSCFHIDRTVGKMPFAVYEKIAKDPQVVAAWPFITGDTLQGFHIVGTTLDFLQKFEYRPPEKFALAEGDLFDADMEAVLGSEVARATGLRVGDRFAARHGMAGHMHDDHLYTVVGILEETFTPHDRAVFCSLGSVDALHDEHEEEDHDKPGAGHKDGKADAHEHHHHDHAHGGGHEHVLTEKSEVVTSMMVLLKTNQLVGEFERKINDGKDAMAVYPTKEINDLFKIVGTANRVLEGVSFLVLLSAGVSILVSLYNSMSERRRDIAIIRALGGPARTVFATILLEAAIICVCGAVLGLAGAYGLLWAAGPVMRDSFGIAIRLGFPEAAEFGLLIGAIGLGLASALLPAVVGYRTDVTTNLRPSS